MNRMCININKSNEKSKQSDIQRIVHEEGKIIEIRTEIYISEHFICINEHCESQMAILGVFGA